MITLLLKRTNVTQKQPSPDQLAHGQLALNYADGKLFYKNVDGTVQGTVAQSATKATQDASGNVIVDTYATKNELQTVISKTELTEQIIGFYNGISGSDLDYRDYLENDVQSLVQGFYDFGNGYQGIQ